MKSEFTPLHSFDISCFLNLPSSFFFSFKLHSSTFLANADIHLQNSVTDTKHIYFVINVCYLALVTLLIPAVVLCSESLLILWTCWKKQEFEMSKPCPSLLLTTCMWFIRFISLCFSLNFTHYIFFLIWRSLHLLVFSTNILLLDVV